MITKHWLCNESQQLETQTNAQILLITQVYGFTVLEVSSYEGPGPERRRMKSMFVLLRGSYEALGRFAPDLKIRLNEALTKTK